MSTITLNAPPDRTTAQRFTALERANEIRSARANLKRDLKHGRVHVRDVLIDPPACITTMRVDDLLTSVPKVGGVRAMNILRGCGVSPSRSVGGLTGRQRGVLAGLLARGVTAKDRRFSESFGPDTMSALRRKEARDV